MIPDADNVQLGKKLPRNDAEWFKMANRNRRQAVAWLGGVLSAAFATAAAPSRARAERGSDMVRKVFPPFELQADRAALDMLATGLSGFKVERTHDYVTVVWLRGCDGQVWSILTDTRDLQFGFEVFTLAVESLEALQARVAAWTPPNLPDNLPEEFRRIFLSRPPVPQAPARFEPWLFDRWRCDVLRRIEFIIDDVAVSQTFGNNPNLQGAATLGAVPPDASATCEVAAGLLFTGDGGKRLLVGVDWTPSNIIWTTEVTRIDDYVKPCEVVSLDAYFRRIQTAG
jgi:hypothetical protein